MGGFKSRYWGLLQVLAWLYTRDRELVDAAAEWESFGMGSLHELVMPRRGKAIILTVQSFEDCELKILEALSTGRLKALALVNNEGAHKEVPRDQWVGLIFCYDPPGAAAPACDSRPGAPRLFDLKFPSEMVLGLWSDPATESTAAEGDEARPEEAKTDPVPDTPPKASPRASRTRAAHEVEEELWNRACELLDENNELNHSDIARLIAGEKGMQKDDFHAIRMLLLRARKRLGPYRPKPSGELNAK